MIILGDFSLNGDELAKAVYSPDVNRGENEYILRATESPVRPEWLRWQIRLDDSAFSERQAGCGQRHRTGRTADNIVIVGTILTFNSGGWDTGRNSTLEVRDELPGLGGKAPGERRGAPSGMQQGEGPRAAGPQRGNVAWPLPHGGGRPGGSEEDEAPCGPLLPLLPGKVTRRAAARGRS